jgi:hypothetical protein
MASLPLEPGEKLIISSRAQFCDWKRFGQFKTGNAFLTDRRFVFMGRLQIKTLFHLLAIAAGKGKRKYEIHDSLLKEIKKKRLENTIEIVYEKGSKEGKALLKPERIPHLGAIIGVGLGAVGEEIGQLVGDSVANTIGESVGEKAGGFLGQKVGELTGKTIKEIHARNLTDAWLKSFHFVMDQSLTGGHPELISDVKPVPAVPGGRMNDPIPKDAHGYQRMLPESVISKLKYPSPVFVEGSHRVRIISLWQIFEEELGGNFGDFEIPISQADYFAELVDRIEGSRNYRERELFSSQLRAYLRHLKQLRRAEDQER